MSLRVAWRILWGLVRERSWGEVLGLMSLRGRVEDLGLGVEGTRTLEVLGEEPAADEPAGHVEDLGLGVDGTRFLEVLGEGPAADEPAGFAGLRRGG